MQRGRNKREIWEECSVDLTSASPLVHLHNVARFGLQKSIPYRGGNMKGTMLFLLFTAVLLLVVGAAFANEMSGVVTAIDTQHNIVTVKSSTMDAGFDCETGTLLKGVKVGDQVTIEYTEAGGKKKATKITHMMKKAPVGC
jgi:Cu/Ag efflux protein CusF